jgi:hypothetical protein
MKVCLFSLFFAITFWTTPVFSQHSQNSNRGYIVKVGDTAPDFIMQMISGDSLR